VCTISKALHTLTTDQRAILDALAETMIPSDALGPGAHEAQVVHFVERALDMLDARATLVGGLEATDAYALAARGVRFASLDAASMAAVLEDVESGRATGFAEGSQAFFVLLRTLVLEGMFGDPRYGGNADYVGWKLIGYPGHKWAVTPAEQRLDVDVEPTYPR
jgi:gluconate 2-dehydrogenase gamma chain